MACLVSGNTQQEWEQRKNKNLNEALKSSENKILVPSHIVLQPSTGQCPTCFDIGIAPVGKLVRSSNPDPADPKLTPVVSSLSDSRGSKNGGGWSALFGDAMGAMKLLLPASTAESPNMRIAGNIDWALTMEQMANVGSIIFVALKQVIHHP
ncbi:Synaptotagmin-14 [Bienertia sinuspersici]